MLPFARILEYGNILPQKPKIVDVQGGSNRASYYILYDNGELYGFYDNFYGNLGLGDRTNRTDKFYLINTNVKMFSAGPSSCVVLKNDNTIWHSGSKTVYTSGADFNLVPTNITSTFSSVLNTSSIKKIICTESTIQILTENGNLYGIGTNSYGQLGRSGVLTTCTLLVSSVQDISCSFATFGYIDTSSNFYATGYNANGQLCTGSTANVFAFKLMDTGVQSIKCSLNTIQVQYLNSDIKGSGQAGNGILGISTITSGNVMTLTNINPVIPSLDISFNSKIYVCNSTASFGTDGTKLYSTGQYFNISQNLSNSTVFKYQECVSPVQLEFDGISVLNSSAWMWKGTDLYYTGVSTYYLNSASPTAISVFTKLIKGLPYYV